MVYARISVPNICSFLTISLQNLITLLPPLDAMLLQIYNDSAEAKIPVVMDYLGTVIEVCVYIHMYICIAPTLTLNVNEICSLGQVSYSAWKLLTLSLRHSKCCSAVHFDREKWVILKAVLLDLLELKLLLKAEAIDLYLDFGNSDIVTAPEKKDFERRGKVE